MDCVPATFSFVSLHYVPLRSSWVTHSGRRSRCHCTRTMFHRIMQLKRRLFLHLSQSDSPEEEELRSTLNSLSAELHKLDDIHWICPLMQCSEEVRRKCSLCSYAPNKMSKFRTSLGAFSMSSVLCLFFRTRWGAALRAAAAAAAWSWRSSPRWRRRERSCTSRSPTALSQVRGQSPGSKLQTHDITYSKPHTHWSCVELQVSSGTTRLLFLFLKNNSSIFVKKNVWMFLKKLFFENVSEKWIF